ncbi:hypothetical protein C1646_763852 [Rhizophagus diaphanus]|nr:hypothetical protein C1646_763852 [Rhizophagus diaphanus] [Rhizophagus sp. MUCL 43196]
MVIADLHQLRTNTQNQVNRMLDNITGKRTRIGILLQEKFALQLLYQRNAHHLQRSRGDIGLLEYNQDRLYERYEKWKNKTYAERQNILILQVQIFALQNNLPHIGMAGYTPKRFSGRANEDIDEFIKDYRLYLTVANITTTNAGANMAAVVVLNNANITAAMIIAPDGTPPPGLAAEATGATVILTHNVYADEDWSLASGCPIDAGIATNAPNGALNNNNHIVLPDINISQVIYWFKRNYPTVVQEQQELIFGTLTQVLPDINISQVIYWFKRNYPTVVQEQQELIFGTLTQGSDSLEMKRLGLNRPLNYELIETLEEIEIERNNLLLGEDIYNQPAIKTKPKTSSHQDISTEDVDSIVNNRIQALQQPPAVQSPASSFGQENVIKTNLQAMFKSFQETISQRNKTLNNSKKSVRKKAEDLAIKRFFSDLLRERGNEAPEVLCTKCGRFGHTSRKYSVKKKKKNKKSKKGKVNLAIELDSNSNSSSKDTPSSDNSDSDTSSSDSSDSDGDLNVHITKSKKK